MTYLANTKTILFITGAFVSHTCWDEWIVYFENKGYKTLSPPWPYKNGSAESLRGEMHNSEIATIGLEFLLHYYIEIIEKLIDKPILIGHSYGGLLTQLLIQKGMGSAGVCLHPFPPNGIMASKLSFYSAIWRPFGYFTNSEETYLMPFKEWQNTFTNSMLFEEQKDSYEKLIVPESKLVIRDILSRLTKINFKKKHKPLLFISGSNDNIVSSALVFSNFKKYKNIDSITCYKEFESNNHLILKQENWENVANFIDEWLKKLSNLSLF